MNAFALTPLHRLMLSHRSDTDLVLLEGAQAVTWGEFRAHVANWTQRFQSRPEPRWLLADEAVMDFCVKLLALICAGKHIVIPPNHLPASALQLAQHGAFDAHSDDAALQGITIAPNHTNAASSVTAAAIDPNVLLIDLYTNAAPSIWRVWTAPSTTKAAALIHSWRASTCAVWWW
jgi:hypothetical protein